VLLPRSGGGGALNCRRPIHTPSVVSMEEEVNDKKIPMCAVLGCENRSDPRWYVHSTDGPLMACDGHGCAGACNCHALEFRLQKPEPIEEREAEEDALKEKAPQLYRHRREPGSTTATITVAENGYTLLKQTLATMGFRSDGVYVAHTFEELVEELWKALCDTKPADTCPYGYKSGRENE
jgi:hypothetical protein